MPWWRRRRASAYAASPRKWATSTTAAPRALRTDRSQIVAVGIHDMTNPYFAELLGVLDEEAGQNGRSILLGTYGESLERQQRVLRTLKEYRPDGIVFCPADGSLILDNAETLVDGLRSGVSSRSPWS